MGDKDPSPPPGDPKDSGPVAPVITDPLLGVVNWWCLQQGKSEVQNLVVRHFEVEEIYKSHLVLAEKCGLPQPSKHKTTAARPALDAYAGDLASNMFKLVQDKLVPLIVIPASELGRVPMGALSISDERSVSARLETLEDSVKSVVSTVERLMKQGPLQYKPAISPSLQALQVPDVAVSFTGPRSYSDVAAKGLQAAASVNTTGGHLGGHRTRSRSPQVKRSHEGDTVDEEGYRQQGRPRNQRRPAASGASKVVVEEAGDLHPSLQYFIGNTPGRADENIIRKVLERCAAALLDSGEVLEIEKVQCLTKEQDPRTKCWRVVVPYKFKDLMENSQLYPEGWRFREFVGTFREPGASSKKPRYGNTVVDQVMEEENREKAEITRLREELSRLKQSPSDSESGASPGLIHQQE